MNSLNCYRTIINDGVIPDTFILRKKIFTVAPLGFFINFFFNLKIVRIDFLAVGKPMLIILKLLGSYFLCGVVGISTRLATLTSPSPPSFLNNISYCLGNFGLNGYNLDHYKS